MEKSATTLWLSDTSDSLKVAMNATDTQQQISEFEETATNLKQLLAEFRDIARADTALRPLGWDGKAPVPALLTDLIEARDTLASRPLTRSIKELTRYHADVRAALIEHWREYASERMGNVSDLQALAETLSQIEGLAALSRGLEESLGELARSQSALPSERSVELLRDAEKKLQALENALQPKTVRRFLSAVARGGAAVDFLTANVATWLREHHAMASFRIVAGAPIGEIDE